MVSTETRAERELGLGEPRRSPRVETRLPDPGPTPSASSALRRPRPAFHPAHVLNLHLTRPTDTGTRGVLTV